MKRASRILFSSLLTLLMAASLACAQQLTFSPFHVNGTYDLGERAGWTLAAPGGKFTYTVTRNNLDVIKAGTLDFSSGTATIEVKMNEPAMLYVDVLPEGSTDPKAAIHLGAAIAPWKLQPSVPRPADFDMFWNGKLKALSAIPMNPVLTPTETKQEGVNLYTVKLDSVGSHMQGYLAKPARDGKFPALVVFQWAGVYALQPEWITGRAAEGWLVLDVNSHDLPPTQPDGVQKDYQTIGNTSRETSYFLNMYLRDSRAIDYIASRPDWDGKTLAITGTSMGGHQSLVAAGLNPKVTAVVINEPAGADSNGELHGRKAGYPFWDSKDPKVMETALYFDTVNFASRIKAPVVVAIGWIDTVCPPVGIWTAVNQIPGPKEVIPMVESDHNNLTPQKQGAWDARSKEALGILLRGGELKLNEELTRPTGRE